MLFIIHVYLIMCLNRLMLNLMLLNCLKLQLNKSYLQLNQCQPFEPHEPHVILLSMICTYACFTFQYFRKILDGYQIARVWRNQACDQPVYCPYGIGVFTRISELSFYYLLSKVISFILSMLYIEHCLSILPLFVAICEI